MFTAFLSGVLSVSVVLSIFLLVALRNSEEKHKWMVEDYENVKEDNDRLRTMYSDIWREAEALEMHARFLQVELDNAHRNLELAISEDPYSLIKDGLYR